MLTLRWAFALLVYLPFGEINIVVVVVHIRLCVAMEQSCLRMSLTV